VCLNPIIQFKPWLLFVPAGVPQQEASMAVLMQELLSPSYSFVLHTASPMGNDPATAEFEVAPGLGETLASGKRGSAWRIAVNKSSGAVKVLAFANFSEGMFPAGVGSRAKSPAAAVSAVGAVGRAGGLYRKSGSSINSSMSGSPTSSFDSSTSYDSGSEGSSNGSGSLYECATRVIDYSKQQLSMSAEARTAMAHRIGAVASCLERAFGGSQDVEGCWVGEELFVVQTRPQP
jgi:phosphoglucan,water dikinase